MLPQTSFRVKVPIAMRFEIVRSCLKQEADQSKPPFAPDLLWVVVSLPSSRGGYEIADLVNIFASHHRFHPAGDINAEWVCLLNRLGNVSRG